MEDKESNNKDFYLFFQDYKSPFERIVMYSLAIKNNDIIPVYSAARTSNFPSKSTIINNDIIIHNEQLRYEFIDYDHILLEELNKNKFDLVSLYDRPHDRLFLDRYINLTYPKNIYEFKILMNLIIKIQIKINLLFNRVTCAYFKTNNNDQDTYYFNKIISLDEFLSRQNIQIEHLVNK